MLERRIATYDKTNFRKRLNEFLEVAKIYKQDDLNEHNIYQVLYKTEQFRNAIYKCIKSQNYVYINLFTHTNVFIDKNNFCRATW